MKTGKKILSAVLTLMMVMSLMAALPVSAAEPTITATLANETTFANGATGVPLVGTITFDFGEALAADYADYVELNEVNPTTGDVVARALTKPISLGSDGNSFVLNFTDGFLAPKGKYQITLKTGLTAGASALEGDKVYTFQTAGNGYYIYDNFSRYSSTLSSLNNTSAEKPWGGYATYASWGVAEANGERYLSLSAPANSTARSVGNRYYCQFIDPDLRVYTDAGTAATALVTETEVDFEINGDTTSAFNFNNSGIVIKADTENANGLALYVNTTRICPVKVSTRYTMKFVASYYAANHTSSTNKYIKQFYLTEAGQTATNLLTSDIQLSTNSNTKTAFTYNNSSSYYTMFGLTGSTDTTAKPSTTMKVYSYKHKPYVPPTPVMTVPATTTDYPVSGSVSFTSSEKLLASTVTAAGAVTMTGPDGAVSCTPSLSDDGKTLTVAYSGLTPGASYNIALANTITSEEKVAIAATPFSFTVAVPDVVTITPQIASGSTIDAAGTLTFTFSEAMKADTINAANIVLKEENKAATGEYLTCVLPTPALAVDKKTMTVTFPEGYLAPNGTYQIVFTPAIVSEEGGTIANETAFTYTTNGNGYYINDSFDRYVKNVSKTQADTPPWYYTEQAYGSYQVKDDNGDVALYLNANANSTSRKMAVGYGSMFIPSDLTKYTAANSEDTAIYAESEMTFKVSGAEDSTFTLGTDLFFIKDTDSEDSKLGYGLYVGSTKLCDVEPDVKYTLKFIGSYYSIEGHTVGKGGRISYITSAVLSTEESAGTELISTPLQLSTNSSVTPCYTYVDGTNREYTIAKATASASSTATTLYLYSFKHKPFVGAAPAIVEGVGALAGNTYSKTITITNNSGKPVSYYVALAAYRGDELVALSVDNVATAVNGQTATVTRTVTDASIAGCTYKLMMLKSLDSLQPLQAAFDGVIQ